MSTEEAFVKGSHLRKVLERAGPFCHAEFEACPDTLKFLSQDCRVLVIGCGGLGCEIIPKLALMGFTKIDVIDMDTIDLSNLNRQFLFRSKDIGRSKAVVAAEYINSRIPGVTVTPHFCKIQDFDENFYSQFHIIISGLDSIVARRWINGMVINMLNFSDGILDQGTVIPLIDGGTEGFKGNARVILPGITACIECTLSLFPPQINFPLCTIANTPRLPEHCIEYTKILLWPKENPFGVDVPIDSDDPAHINWIYEKSLERAKKFSIDGVTYRLTSGVIKHIIPSVASTNAIIASACVSEAFKLATSVHETMNNYMVFNDVEGIYTYTYEQEKNPNCIACSSVPQKLRFKLDIKLQEVYDYLCNSSEYQMKSPCLTTTDATGKNQTLYMQTIPSIEKMTKPNLNKTLAELNLFNNQLIYVADVTTPNTMIFKLLAEPDA